MNWSLETETIKLTRLHSKSFCRGCREAFSSKINQGASKCSPSLKPESLGIQHHKRDTPSKPTVTTTVIQKKPL